MKFYLEDKRGVTDIFLILEDESEECFRNLISLS